MDEIITSKEVKFVNDPKNLSALAKIHEMSNKAKERKSLKSPTNIHHINVNDKFYQDEDDSKFSRRKSHFATMRYPAFNNIIKQKDDINQGEGIRKSYINNKEKTGSKEPKSEYILDKNLNRLIEKKTSGLEKIDENDEKIEPKIKIDSKKSDKNEILQKLKDYKKTKENDSGKKTEVVFEKKIVKEDEINDENISDKNITGSKNTKIYKKIVKDENGSKIIIEKKIIEEITGNKDVDLVFEEDSYDEDIEKELDQDKKDMKYQIIREKFDPQRNKIYTKEIFTNKLPKGK